MDIANYIKHPEQIGKETLYDIRSLLSLHPYYQPARLLLLKNLYLLHDPTFDEELRRAAVYVTDRKTLFDLVERAHYELRPQRREEAPEQPAEEDRTSALIDNFLEQMPEEKPQEKRRKPTPADATIDYVSYLIETGTGRAADSDGTTPQLKGQNLIDDFLSHDDGKIQLREEPEYELDDDASDDAENEDTGFFTETLARIYIKQGRYSKALEIIKRLNLIYPKKNRYFADQIRFLEKLIINNKE